MSEISSENLAVSLDGDAIVLTRGPGVTELQWQAATSWWSPVSISDSNSLIRIPIILFNSRKLWLRTHWRDSQLTVAVGDGVVSALRQLDEEIAIFENRLLSSRPTEADVKLYLDSCNYIRQPTVDQARNILSLLGMKHGANFSVPGAGKTSTEYLVWDSLKNQNLVDRMLVVCPKSSFEAWKSEPIAIFHNPPETAIYGSNAFFAQAKVLTVNYEQIERPHKLRELRQWVSNGSTLLVIDEAHRIKGGTDSVRWQSVRQLSIAATRTDLLTGTPLPQGLDDLRNLLSVSWNKLPSNYLNDAKLQTLRPWSVFVRTTKKQLNLPPVTIEKVLLEMGPIQKEIYSALGRNYQGLFAANRTDKALLAKKGRAIFTLIGAATNPGLVMKSYSGDSYLNLEWPPAEIQADPKLVEVLSKYARHEMPPKYQWLARFVAASAAEDRKVLVWSTFVGNLRAVQRILKPYNPAVVHGGVTGTDRDFEIDKFRNDPTCKVLISNPQTLGEGISLHLDCHDAVFLDRSFNAGQYLQALDRIHRLGLPRDQDTRIFLLETLGTIDGQVDARLNAKISVLADVLDDDGLVKASLPNDDENLQSPLELLGLDNQDLEAIFSHLRTTN